jgi:hypothetical protein
VSRWFQIEEWIRKGENPFLSVSAVNTFPEPMMKSWLRVIAYHWTKDRRYLEPLIGTRLYHAAIINENPIDRSEDADPFADYVSALHAEKHAAYGDSWKARGELFSILPNVARKVDRLGTGKETADETRTDTAIDLLVYLLKYRLWLAENFDGVPVPAGMLGDHVEQVGRCLRRVSHVHRDSSEKLVIDIHRQFNALLVDAEEHESARNRATRVDGLIAMAGPLAYRLWSENAPEDEPEERMHEAASARWAG